MNQELIQYQNANQSFDEVIDNFVVRHKEFERVINDIRTTKDGSSFQHYVFVGRRGSGKSTILRRIEAEIVKDVKLSSKYLAVNLGEEQSGIYRLYDLFDYVIRELNAFGIEINKVDFRDYKDDMKEYTKVLHAQIIEILRAKNKKLILLIDNIDRVLYNRGNTDDAALLRELLMNFKDIRIIGGSTVMSEHFWKYDMPFYQFFSIKNLEPLTLVEVEKLLNHWSEKKQLPEIKNIIKLHPGKIQSIRMLTDGLPRTMLLFVDMLINRPMQHGYEYLQIIIDKATPIYQERLGTLSPAQRKVLSELAYLWDAASVEELIPKCNMDGKTISALLHQLTQTRDVEKIKSDTKNNFYRIEERFFNLWFNMTQGGLQQRMEAKALTDFLEIWYNKFELENICYEFTDNLKKGDKKKDYAEVMSQSLHNSTLIAMEPQEDLYLTAKNSELVEEKKLDTTKNYFEDFDESINKAFSEENYEKALDLLNISDIEDGRRYYGIGLCYQYLLNNKEAEKNYKLSAQLENLGSIYNLANMYFSEGRIEEAEKYYLKAIDKENIEALNNIGNLYVKIGKTEKAKKYFLLAIDKNILAAFFNLANLHHSLGDTDQAEKYFLLAIEKGHLEAINNLANLYSRKGDVEKAEKYYNLAINYNIKKAFYNLLFCYYINNKKTKLKNELKNIDIGLFDEIYENNDNTLSIFFVYIGDFESFQKVSNQYLSGKREVSNNLLLSLLIHKQINWVNNYFKQNPKAKDQYKSLYYATMFLVENKTELLKMPPEINENVNDIISEIKKKQEFYYGK